MLEKNGDLLSILGSIQFQVKNYLVINNSKYSLNSNSSFVVPNFTLEPAHHVILYVLF